MTRSVVIILNKCVIKSHESQDNDNEENDNNEQDDDIDDEKNQIKN